MALDEGLGFAGNYLLMMFYTTILRLDADLFLQVSDR